MLFALLSLAGFMAYKANPVQDFPDIELPIVTVTATLDGSAPAQLETEVSRKIEDSVATLQGVKTSTPPCSMASPPPPSNSSWKRTSPTR
jgi:multidrug efflux pump subunit AcrB